MTIRRRIILTASLGVLLLGGVGVAISLNRSAPLPPISTSAPELAKFAGTDTFRNLTADQKQPYVQKLEAAYFDEDPDQFSNLTPEEFGVVWRNLMEGAIDLRLRRYYAQRTPADREKMLDDEINLMQKRVGQGLLRMLRPSGAKPQAAPPSFGPPRSGMTAQQQKDRLENMDSARLAMMAEFMSAMRTRAEERGLKLGMPQPK